MLHARDTIRFISKLTMAKAFNLARIWTSYQLTRLTGQPLQWGTPMTISIEPTTACNLRCPECPSGLRSFTRETGNLKEDFFRKVIDEQYRRLMYLIFYFQGEPYINPKFLDMVKYAHRKGVYTITSTNGHFLTPEKRLNPDSTGYSYPLTAPHRMYMSNTGKRAPWTLYLKGHATWSKLKGKQDHQRLTSYSKCWWFDPMNTRSKTSKNWRKP